MRLCRWEGRTERGGSAESVGGCRGGGKQESRRGALQGGEGGMGGRLRGKEK